jgi:DNA-directed RNA polymerase specialized sigma24 family protein
MPQETEVHPQSLFPPQPIPPAAQALNERIQGMMDGQPKDEAAVSGVLTGMDELLDLMGAALYNLASMLVGEGEESIALVETAIANAEIALCQDTTMARQNSRRALCRAAVELIGRREPASLQAPEGAFHVVSCLEEDDLEGAGISREDLDRMIAGPERGRVREWLESLPVATRVVFVLRAVAGLSGAETAGILAEHGGVAASGWTPAGVRELFRLGLCSLASQLLHASATR